MIKLKSGEPKVVKHVNNKILRSMCDDNEKIFLSLAPLVGGWRPDATGLTADFRPVLEGIALTTPNLNSGFLRQRIRLVHSQPLSKFVASIVYELVQVVIFKDALVPTLTSETALELLHRWKSALDF